MIDTPKIVQSVARQTAVIRLEIPRAEIRTVMGPAIAEVIAAVTAQGIGPAWAELNAWIAAAGHKAAPGLWECYVAGPESAPDPAKWRTELNRPLVKRA